jgi:hypothetical protein
MELFRVIPEYPVTLRGVTVMQRLMDGLGFRFYWATEELRVEDYAFRPAEDVMSIRALVEHIWGLVNWVNISINGVSQRRPEEIESVRRRILEIIFSLRSTIANMSDDDFNRVTIEGRPLWNIINGPISDALTHVGQINSFRRLNGNPVPRANVFLGKPPTT